jgi:hypothetical protein
MRQNIITLSLAGYPMLIARLTRLVADLEQAPNSPIVTLALFGSVARLMAGQSSDADLLALHMDGAPEDEAATWLIHHIRAAAEANMTAHTSSGEFGWRMIPVFGNAQASDLDPDFLASVAQDGILLYQRPNIRPPGLLAHLRGFAAWRDEVAALMDALSVAAVAS